MVLQIIGFFALLFIGLYALFGAAIGIYVCLGFTGQVKRPEWITFLLISGFGLLLVWMAFHNAPFHITIKETP